MHESLRKHVLVYVLLSAELLEGEARESHTGELYSVGTLHLVAGESDAPARHLVLHEQRVSAHEQVAERTLQVYFLNKLHAVAHVAHREPVVVVEHAHIVELTLVERYLEAVVSLVAHESIRVVVDVAVRYLDVARELVVVGVEQRETHVRYLQAQRERVALARSESAADAVVAEVVLAHDEALVGLLRAVYLDGALAPSEVEHNLLVVLAHYREESVWRDAEIHSLYRLHLLVALAEHTDVETAHHRVVFPVVGVGSVGAEHHKREAALLACAVSAADEIRSFFWYVDRRADVRVRAASRVFYLGPNGRGVSVFTACHIYFTMLSFNLFGCCLPGIAANGVQNY